jgi:hypothetical protein
VPSSAGQRFLLLLPALVACLLGTDATAATSDDPETVIVTYQVKADAEAALSRVIAEHWRVARHMHLVRPSPHIVVQGGERGKRYIVEVFTWRDGSIPDNAPDEITRLWQEMNALVESRDDHPGIDFSRVSILAP